MGINSVETPMGHHINSIPSTMMVRACLVLAAMVLCPTEASYGYGGSGQAYILPGTEPRAMPGIYKQEYMQPVYITSYVPVHHEQHASPVQYVTVAPNSGHHHAPAPAVHAPALGGMAMLLLLPSAMDILLLLQSSAMTILPLMSAMDIPLLLRLSAMIILPLMLAMDIT